MGYLDKSAKYDTVSLDSGDTVTIQRYRGDAADLINAALMRGARTSTRRLTSTSDGESVAEVEEEMDGGAYLYETCVQGIVKWTCDGAPEPEGTLWPVDVAHLKLLTHVDRQLIFKRVQDLNSPLDPKKNSTG